MPKSLLFLCHLAVVLAVFLAPTLSHAGAFCVRPQGQQPQCLYDDAGECRRRAAQLSGVCTANPDVLTITATNGQFCLVTTGGAMLCAYLDRASCEKEADRKNGVCIDSTVQGVQPDLHRDMPGRLY